LRQPTRVGGFGKGKHRWSGLAYPSLQSIPFLGELEQFLKSDRFCRALLEKFSRPNAIPAEKYKYFANGAHDFTSVFDLQIARRGYEILRIRTSQPRLSRFSSF
jgi:hypothetical protein